MMPASVRSLPTARRTITLIAAALALAPSALLAIASLWWTMSAPAGGGLWPPVRQTLSEAAAAGDVGEVVWQVQTGADPNARFPVRAGLLADDAVTTTPLEAAVWAHDAEMVSLLLAHGAIVDPPTVTTLRCINLEHGADSRIDALLPAGAPVSSAACDTALPAR
jgi:hypothetical protein